MTSVLCVYLTCGFNVCVTRSFRNQNSSSRKSICGMVLVSRGWPDHCHNYILSPEHKRNQFREQFKCVRRTWELVKGKLTEYGTTLSL